MERDKKKNKPKNIQDSDYSDNNIHVNINVGTSDNHTDDNSVVNDVTEIKEVQEKTIEDKTEIDNTDLLLSNLKRLIKEFNQKKEELINRRIDIPNDIFDLPDIDINSRNDIIRFSDILRDKINQLNKILINTKKEIQIEPSKSVPSSLPVNPYMNSFQTNMRNAFPFNTGNPYQTFPTNVRTPPEDDTTTTTTDDTIPSTTPVEPTPVEPTQEPESPNLTPAQEEIEKNLLMFLEEDFGKYEKYYFDNKNTTDVSRLRQLIEVQEQEIKRLQKIKNELFLDTNKNKVDGFIIEVQGNKSNTNIALRNLMDIKPDDDGDDEDDFNENNPPTFEEPILDQDLVNRKNTLLAYKSRMNNTGRSPNGYLLVDRELNRNLDFINNAIIRGDDLTIEEKNYVLSQYNIMDNTAGVFEPAKAYRNISTRVLSKTDILTLELLEGEQDKYILILNGNQEVIDNENSRPVRFDKNGDIYFEENTNDSGGGGRRPAEEPEPAPVEEPEPESNEEEFPEDQRTTPSWGHWYDGIFGTGPDGRYEDGL